MATTNELKAALTQVFKISVPGGISGMYATSIDLFFRKKSSSFGLELSLVELTDGQPDTSKVVSNSTVRVTAEGVKISDNGSVATNFKFPNPVWLVSGNRYAFVLRALGGSPDFAIWTGLNGATDIATGKSISSNPLSEQAYFAKSTADWAEIPNEDIKYKLYRAKFSTSPATVILRKSSTELFKLKNVKYATGYPEFIAGDEIFGVANTGMRDVSKYAKVVAFDDVNNILYLRNSTGNFATDNKLTFVRSTQEGPNKSSTAVTGVIAEAQISELLDFPVHAIVPKIGNKTNALGTVKFDYRGTYKEGSPLVPVKEIQAGDWKTVTNHEESEFYDKTRYVLSRSSEVARLQGNSSVELRATLTSNTNFISPVLDLRERSLIGIKNLVGANTSNEDTIYGGARTKYVSKIVTLADGQEAEDLKVFITAYKPPRTIIQVYAKLWNSEDSEDFDIRKWTLMNQITDAGLFSDPKNVEDYREYEFDLPSIEVVPGAAYCPNNGVDNVQYNSSAGTFIGYKKFSIKVVMAVATDEDAYNYPRLSDVRGIALQK